ncbi:WRKY DNA-binding protein 50 [Actinidia rufa]|uniref:WRKY DNA-binding protein 50 n=1 Tax=Actinidia rufa TaxID=165716 RepID=A0A7J0FDG5_9ERIC|nr:WRKY DNA-binding protein 50 [Actinidia rufa]
MDSQENSYANQSNFELSEFFEFDEWEEEDPGMVVSDYPQNPVYAANDQVSYVGGSSSHHERPSTKDPPSGREEKVIKEKVAFKTKSEVEILEDGFKWRKYGKKMVKNSPNPRNYYRCSVEGCPVKKRVERDREDPRYVITTYEGVHTHQGPSRF